MAKPRYSQVFLKDPNILKKIVEKAEVKEDEWVLEIGPGKGYLTSELLKAGAKVVAIELDKDLFWYLKEEFLLFLDDRLFLFQGDFLKQDLGQIFRSLGIKELKVVSNIPYHITTPILEKLTYNRNFFPEIYLTIQREVAERIVARPGTKEYGALTVFLNLYFDCEVLFKIPRFCFSPIPKVDSSFVRLKRKEVADQKEFESFVRRLFSGRRKKVRTLLRAMSKYNEGLESIFPEFLDLRPEELDLSQLYQIFTKVNAVKDPV